MGAVSGLVDEPDQVLPAAMEMARKVAALSPIAVQYTNGALNHSMQRAALDHFEFAGALEQYAMA